MQAFAAVVILRSHQIGFFEGGLTCRYISRMIGNNVLIRVIDLLRDQVAHLVITLAEDATRSTTQVVGRSVFITIHLIIFLFLFCSSAIKLSVPGIPIRWVVDPVGQHITRVMTQVVGGAEDKIKVHIFLQRYIIDGGMGCLEGFILARQEYAFGRDNVNVLAAILAIRGGDICLVNKQLLLRLGQQVPIPIADGIVQVIGGFVDHDLLALLQFIARRSIISVLVGHHVEQLHGTMRSGRDGQRNIYRLTIGIRSTRIS